MPYTTINKSTDYFNTKLYVADQQDNRTITGVGFQPDFVWLRDRDQAVSHQLYDSVRGALKSLSSNTSGAEATETDTLKAFASDGFTLGTGWGNQSTGDNNVSWNWKAGTTGSGNTGGSGTSKTYSYSVNTTSGISIIKYEGNGTNNHQIPHHLGAVPKMIIFKNFQAGYSWDTYHVDIGNAHRLYLNSNVAKQSATNFLYSTTPTSTYINLGDAGHTNDNGTNHIAYCFTDVPGYQKCGSYSGNGSTSGPMCFTGFKPAMVFFKRTGSGTANWQMWDNKRDPHNPVEKALHPDINNTASADQDIDFLSNGFKIRSSANHLNASGEVFIYYAVAEAPLVGSNNIPCTAR